MNGRVANSFISNRDRVLDALYRNRRRVATGCAMLVAAGFGYFAVAGENGIKVYKQKRADERQLAQQIETMKQENSKLQDHIERLKSDPEAIEHEARDRFHYTKAGEVIYTLPDTPSPSQSKPLPKAPASNQ